MPDSPERGSGVGPIRRLRRRFERLLALPQDERRAAAERMHGDEPAFLGELLRLLDCPEPTASFLEPPSTRAAAAAPDLREPPAAAGQTVGRRWRLVRRIGSGGQGVVWEANDVVAGARAAVKFLRRAAAPEITQISRESAVLRWLRLPGVVRLLDDGRHAGAFWIAMELVEGAPFPSGPARAWEDVAPSAIGLLETLARIHGAGVVHGDLKPSNVLVDRSGVVTVLDLGLACALVGGAPGASLRGGTPGYAAPEFRAGAVPDVRTDLYAVGVLLFGAVAGRHPRPGEAARWRPEGVPSRVVGLVRRLLDPRPSARPASAASALASLRTPHAGSRTRVWTELELRSRFCGHDRFHHVPEDAARELFRRTHGRPASVHEELAAWMRAGLARDEGGRVAIDRVALDRLASAPHVVRDRRTAARAPRADALTAALRDGSRAAIAAAALRAGRKLLADGRPVRALSALEIGAAAARGLRTRATLRKTLLLATSSALATATAHEIERALWLVRRFDDDLEFAPALADVLRAAAASHAGDRATAAALAARVTRHGPAEVQQLAWSVRALVAQSLDLRLHRRLIADAERWARTARTGSARRAVLTWKAWLCYREGRCTEAARMHRRNATRAPTRFEAQRSLMDAAAAAADAGETGAAIAISRVAREQAAALRLPVREARAYWIERAARLADGARLVPDMQALAAVSDLGFDALNWSARMIESVAAWKRGDPRLALEILEPLPVGASVQGLALHEIPVACLAVGLGVPCAPARARALGRRAVRETAAPLALQCLAMLRMGGAASPALLRRLAAGLRTPSRGRDFSRARELMSVQEARAVLARRG